MLRPIGLAFCGSYVFCHLVHNVSQQNLVELTNGVHCCIPFDRLVNALRQVDLTTY